MTHLDQTNASTRTVEKSASHRSFQRLARMQPPPLSKVVRYRSSVIGIVILLGMGLTASVGLQLRRDHAQALIQNEQALNANVATLALALRGVANPERLGRVVQDSVAQLPEGMALAIIGERGDIVVSSTGERPIQGALARLARESRSFTSPQTRYVATTDDRQVLAVAAAIPGTELVLTAGSPVSYILAAWWRSIPFYLMLIAGPIIIMLALAILLVREMERDGTRSKAPKISNRLAEADGRSEMLLKSVPVGIALWSPRGKLIEANDLFNTHLGLDSAKGLYLTLLERKAGLIAASLADETALAGFAHLSDPNTTLFRRGEVLVLESRKTLAGGETLSTTLDVTALRARSEALTRTERDLLNERARAETAEQAKSSLFASASHELRTPLNAILGFSEIMKDGVLGPLGHDKYVEYAKDIHESGHRLLRLVDGLLAMSKVENGEATLKLVPVDPTAVARECLVDLTEYAKGRDVELIGRLILVPEVTADANALRQVFIHLITNALRRAAPGARVEMGCESGSEDVRFTLRNIGPMAPESDAKRTMMLGAGGVAKSNAGLGLAIARSLIQLQGGELMISSEADGSVSLAFTLPRQSAVSRRERAA